MDPLFNIVLYEPEIPNNTGNIGRTCVGMNCALHLIEPLGFEIDDKRVKRAGLDYWPNLNLTHHKSYEKWLDHKSQDTGKVYFFSTKAEQSLFDVNFHLGDHLVFGPETRGLPEMLLRDNMEQVVKIPLLGSIRSFNLANAVSIAILEAYRQTL